jgi:hypothetical protein
MKQKEDIRPIEYSDPDLLQILGSISDVLGLTEHMQRILPLTRLRAKRRHRRIENLRKKFKENMEGSRVSLKAIKSMLMDRKVDLSKGQIAISIPRDQLSVYRKALEQMQGNIRNMTNAAYELEEITIISPDEAKGYYKISKAGEPVLQALKDVFIGSPEALSILLDRIESYLSHCSDIFSHSDQGNIF